MTETLTHPVLKEDDPELDALMAAAAQADRGEDITLPSTPKSGDRASAETETKPEETSSTDTAPETEEKQPDERPRDELGRFTKREDGSDIPEAEREKVSETASSSDEGVNRDDSRPDSAYEKARKDQERLNRNRQEFEAEKARERDQLAQERARIAEERRQIEEARRPQQPEGRKVTSAEYAEFAQEATRKAKEARSQGDYDQADEQSDLAAKATQAALESHKREQVESNQQMATQSQNDWESEMVERIRQEPELQKADTPLAKETMAVMGAYPVFERIPPIKLPDGKIMGGFSFATEVAKLRLKAGSASVLEQENTQLKAEVKRLNELTGIGGAGPAVPVSTKTFEQMTPEQQDAYLERNARRIDAGY